MEEKKKDSTYELDETVPLKKALPPGIQHVLVMFLGSISPLIIVYGMLKMGGVLKMTLVQNAMFIAGIVTLSQLYPFWKAGSGLPIIMGISSGFIGTVKAVGVTFGYDALIGANFIGGIFEVIMRYFIEPLRKLFPPVATSLIVISVGLSLPPVGIDYFGGGNDAADFGSTDHLLVGAFVTIAILIAKQFKGTMNNASILIGIVAGYILATALSMVDSIQVPSASWFALPAFMPVAFGFNSQAIIAMGIMFITTTVETIGDVSGVANSRLNQKTINEELQGGVMADSLNSTLGTILDVLLNTSSSQSTGLVAVTKVANRFIVMTDAVFLILCGSCLKLSVLFSVTPQSALGGAAVITFVMILISGTQSLARELLDKRNGLTIALAIGLGVGIGDVPAVLAQLPSWVGNISAQNGIITTFVVATVLNLILSKEKSEEG